MIVGLLIIIGGFVVAALRFTIFGNDSGSVLSVAAGGLVAIGVIMVYYNYRLSRSSVEITGLSDKETRALVSGEADMLLGFLLRRISVFF